jgi:MarR family transcriptional regulator, negative regulator of the multidrug operon emrRAB
MKARRCIQGFRSISTGRDMSESIFFPLRDLPKYETIRARATRYPEVQAGAVESFLILMRVGSDILSAFDKYLARHKMSMGSFTTLMLLNRDPTTGMNPSDLATKCGVTRATMTGLLDGLERKKLLCRESAQVDRRTILIRLTPHGIATLEGMIHDYYKRVAMLMSGLSDDEQRKLSHMLLKVGKKISDVYGR